MSKNFIAILITVIMSFTMVCSVEAQGLPGKPDVTDFTYTLKDSNGDPDTAITSGGSLEVELTLKNNTSEPQPYIILLQMLNNGKKVSLKAAQGELGSSAEEIVCLSDGFPESETDFSKYSAEVYVWSDLADMQPISAYSVFGSDNNDIYAYKIDNTDLVYANNNTDLSHSFAEGYSGTPVITPIFRDLASKCISSDAAETVTSDGQQTLSFLVESQKGTTKNYSLTMYGEDNPRNTKNAYLKSITLPTAKYDGNYNEIGFLYPAFNKDVTEYDVYTYLSSYGQEPLSYFDLAFEAVNSNATVAKTTVPDTSLAETYAVYTVTSVDSTVTKDYKINYHAIGMTDNSCSITSLLNGLDKSTGGTEMWGYYTNAATNAGSIVIQDGTFSTNKKAYPSRTIIEIDIENGPEKIDHGILTLANTSLLNTKDTNPDSGTMKIYKIDDSIYSVDGGLTSIAVDATKDYFGDEMCSVPISPKTGNRGDIYFINIDASYYNALKAAGKTKMYLGIAGVGNNRETQALGIIIGGGGTGVNNSRFHAITE